MGTIAKSLVISTCVCVLIFVVSAILVDTFGFLAVEEGIKKILRFFWIP